MSEAGYIEIPKNQVTVLAEPVSPIDLDMDDQAFRDHFRSRWDEIHSARRGEITFMEALEAGFEGSVSGLLKNKEVPRLFLPEDPSWADRTAYQLGALAGDFPFMTVGAALGAAEGGGIFSAATAGGGALALPAGIRRVLMEQYEHGKIGMDFGRFWQVLSAAVVDEFKAWTLGAVTGGAGKVARISPVLPRTAEMSAEIATLGTMGAALEGRVPGVNDFTDAATVVGGLRGARWTASKMRNVYVRTGRQPFQIVEDTEADPTIKEDLSSVNMEVPRAYEAIKEEIPSQERVTAKPSEAEAGPTGDEAFEGIKSRISWDEKPQGRPFSFHDVYTHWVESVHPLGEITRAMTEAIQKDDPSFVLKISEDPYRLSRLRPGVNAVATHFVDWAPIRFADRMPLGKPLRRILGPVRYIQAWDVYAAAKRSIELRERGIETGMDEAFAKKVVEDWADRVADKKGTRTYEEVREEQRQFSRYVLEYLRDSEVISNESFDLINELNESYVPFERFFETEKPRGKGARPQGAMDPIRRIFGSEEKIISPSETILKNTYLLVRAAENNRIATKLVELAEASPEGRKFAKRQPTKVRRLTVTDEEKDRLLKKFTREQEEPMDDESLGVLADFLDQEMEFFRPEHQRPKPDQIQVFREGKREIWTVDPEVAEAIHGATAGEMDLLQKFFTAPARTLRAGAILTPEFMARNPVRDAFMAFINSESGHKMFWTWMSGVRSFVKNDDWMAAYERSGGPMAEIVALDRTYNQATVQDLARSLWWRNVRNGIRNPIEGFRLLATVSEAGTRIGEFKRALRRRGVENPMEADIDALLESGLEAREISLDFGRIGSKAAAWNRVIPFFNASIQGTDKMARNFKNRPAATMSKIAVSITIPSLVLHLQNRNIPGWDEIPQWQKDLFWLKHLDGDRLSSVPELLKVRVGDDVWMRAPKPFEVGILFGSGAERIADAILDKNPHAFDDFMETVWRGMSPGFVPTALAPIIETFGNRSLWLDRPLIPKRREGILPQFQYWPYTTQLTRVIGKQIARLPVIGDTRAASPAVIDTFVRDWSGGLGVHAINLADAALRKAGVIPDPPRPMDTLADIPGVRGFFVRHPSFGSETLSRFYDRYEQNRRILDTIEVLRRDGEFAESIRLRKAYAGHTVKLEQMYRAISRNASIIRKMNNNPDPAVSPEERSQIQDNLLHMMVLTARAGNEIFDRLEKTP